MRVVIISSNSYLDKRIVRLLAQNNIKGDIEKSITRQVLQQYDCIIVSSKNDVPNLPIVLERITLEKQIHIIYISNTASIGQFYNVFNSLYFNIVNELVMEVELPTTIKLVGKYSKQLKMLQTENDEIKDQYETLQLTNKAKRVLMGKGISEADSHQFIQRKAMDLRLSKKQIVNLIIENKIDF